MCRFSPSASRLTHDVVSDVLFVCVHSSICFSLLLEDGVPYVRLMIHLCSQRGLKQLSSSVCVLSPYRFFVMLSFAAELSSVASVSPPSSFETCLDWLQSGVVHPGKPKKQKGRRVISERQARCRERRLDVKALSSRSSLGMHSEGIRQLRRTPRSFDWAAPEACAFALSSLRRQPQLLSRRASLGH